MPDQRLKLSIVGKSPLLCHNPASMGKQEAGPKGEKKIPSPEVEAKAGLYLDPHTVNGQFCFPGIGVRNAIVLASGAWKVKIAGSSRKVSSKMFVSTVMVEPEFIPILTLDGKPAKTYAVDSRRAVVQKNGIVRSRPKFEAWRLDFEVVYDDEVLNDELVQMLPAIANDAGKRIGIGDYRPAKTGWFGRFEVKS